MLTALQKSVKELCFDRNEHIYEIVEADPEYNECRAKINELTDKKTAIKIQEEVNAIVSIATMHAYRFGLKDAALLQRELGLGN